MVSCRPRDKHLLNLQIFQFRDAEQRDGIPLSVSGGLYEEFRQSTHGKGLRWISSSACSTRLCDAACRMTACSMLSLPSRSSSTPMCVIHEMSRPPHLWPAAIGVLTGFLGGCSFPAQLCPRASASLSARPSRYLSLTSAHPSPPLPHLALLCRTSLPPTSSPASPSGSLPTPCQYAG